MAIRFDIQLNNNDLVINTTDGGDVMLVESDDQHVIDTINACAGWWKENPADGVAIMTYLKGTNITQKLTKNIKLQLQSDGYNCNPIVTINSDKSINVNPNVTL